MGWVKSWRCVAQQSVHLCTLAVTSFRHSCEADPLDVWGSWRGSFHLHSNLLC